MKYPICALFAAIVLSLSAPGALAADFTGRFDGGLVPNVEDDEQVIFRPGSAERLKPAIQVSAGAHVTMGRLFDPMTEQYSVAAFLVEEPDTMPVLYVDLNGDGVISTNEEIELKRRRSNDPRVWVATVELQVKGGKYPVMPTYVQYLRNVVAQKMSENDRLVLQSTELFARGSVNVNGKPVLVQYAYKPRDHRVTPHMGWLGMDSNGDGEIDMHRLSPEAARADEEAVVFRVGSTYLSTKRADIGKNEIVLRDHAAKDYKRLELNVNGEFPDFQYTDFDGKKRKFSDMRGKYVLVDVWGFWCKPCQRELPYIREAHKRFGSRNLEVLGLNTDDEFTLESMNRLLKENQMMWPNARYDSVRDLIKSRLRITSFPTTFLVSPEGKILSMSRTDRDEASLRGSSLLRSLDRLLTPGADARPEIVVDEEEVELEED